MQKASQIIGKVGLTAVRENQYESELDRTFGKPRGDHSIQGHSNMFQSEPNNGSLNQQMNVTHTNFSEINKISPYGTAFNARNSASQNSASLNAPSPDFMGNKQQMVVDAQSQPPRAIHQ